MHAKPYRRACIFMPHAAVTRGAKADHSTCQLYTLGVMKIDTPGPSDAGLAGAGSGDFWDGGICLRSHGGQPAERRKACLHALTREDKVMGIFGPKNAAQSRNM